jgi:hypothetical protein
MKNMLKTMICMLSLLSLTSCAAGSLTAGYAARCNVADSLTSEGEQKIVDRAKKEIVLELKSKE